MAEDQTKRVIQNQHYVPQILLRKFASRISGNQHYIWAFDKTTAKSFEPNIKGIAAERDFHVFEDSGYEIDFEPIFTAIESSFFDAHEKLISTECVHSLNQEQKDAIISFVTLQFVRTKRHREWIRQINRESEEHILRLGFDPNEVKGFRSLDENSLKAEVFRMIRRSCPIFYSLIEKKDWVLLRNQTEIPFYLSDNPVVLVNDTPSHGIFSNLGLGVQGIQIFMPLSPRLTLGLICPSIFKSVIEDYEKYKKVMSEVEHISKNHPLPNIRSDGIEKLAALQSLPEAILLKQKIDTFSAGMPEECSPEMVENWNGMQTAYAYRYVFSSTNDFANAITSMKKLK